MAEAIIQTSNNVKQNFRDYMRRYFRSEYNIGMLYIRDIVLMLMNFKEINILNQEIGQEDYQKTKQALQAYGSLYNYANLISDNIIKMQEKHEGELLKTKINIQNHSLMKIAEKLPAVNYRIWRAFFILVNNCDLKNIAVPKEERFDSRKQYPSYLEPERGSY